MSVVCCQVEVSTSGCSLVQRSPNDCGVSECDREASIMRRTWPTRGCCTMGKKRSTQSTNDRFLLGLFSDGDNTEITTKAVLILFIIRIFTVYCSLRSTAAISSPGKSLQDLRMSQF